MPMRKWPITAVAVLILGLATGGEAVNLSRYRLTVTVSSNGRMQTVDLGKMRGFCRDEDGCWVTLRYEGFPNGETPVLEVKTTHLFLAPGSLVWSTTDGLHGEDANVAIEFPLDIHIGQSSCVLSDSEVDSPTGADAGPGFTMTVVNNQADANCVLTLID